MKIEAEDYARGLLKVGNFHPDLSLYDTFEKYGALIYCTITGGTNGKSSAYIRYVSHDSAEKAQKGIDGIYLHDMKIAVAMVEKDDFFHENHSKTVFVKYLPSFADDKDLYEAFGKHGKLLFCEVRLLKEMSSDETFSPGYAAVTYESYEVKEKVLRENNVKIKNKKVSVSHYYQRLKPKPEFQENYLENRLNNFIKRFKSTKITDDKRKHAQSDKVMEEHFQLSNAFQRLNSVELFVYGYDNVDDLTKNFESFGTVTGARICKNDNTGENHCCGYLRLPDRKAAQNAIKSMKGQKNGRKVVDVKFSKNPIVVNGTTYYTSTFRKLHGDQHY